MNRIKPATLALLLAGACSETVEKPAENPPPPWGTPVSGGTMTVTRSNHAVIADPDRDRILSVDLSTGAVVEELELTAGDEPGRVIEDGAGRLHVALRRGGSMVTLKDAASLDMLSNRPVCAEPRGLAWDAATDAVHVACTTGELVSLPASGGTELRRLQLDRDLRDVVVSGSQLVVTRFRSSETIVLDRAGVVQSRVRPPDVERMADFGDVPPPPGDELSTVPSVAAVAWRAMPLGDGRVVVAHQRQIQNVLKTKQPGGYGGGCGKPVESSFSIVTPGTGTNTATVQTVTPLATGSLPVDAALSPQGDILAVVLAGGQEIQLLRASALAKPDDKRCPDDKDPQDDAAPSLRMQLGTPTSLAWTPNGELAIFYPELPALVVWSRTAGTRTLTLPGEVGYDAGRALFHGETGVGVSCASCHPEGRDDGLVWNFDAFGARRTQSLAGGILRRAPYHWGGDMADLGTLMDDVFANRMLGGTLDRSQRMSLGPWLDRIPAPAGHVVDAAAVARGAAIFTAQDTECASCHQGELFTSNQLVDVGTGGPIKVPSLLGVGYRAPFMHTGCATTLAARFDPACGGGELHGKTAHLTAAQIADLVAYLESL